MKVRHQGVVRNKSVYLALGVTTQGTNSSLRKLVRHRGHFASDEAVTKLFYLALRNIEQRWNRCAREWSKALGQFAVFFEGRLPSV